jgi:hypothetical protein
MRILNKVMPGLLIVLLSCMPAYASFITSAGDPALSSSALIDFEAQASGSFTSLTIGNVTFSTSGGQVGYVDSAFSGQYNASGQSLKNSYAIDAFNSLRISFASAVSAFGFNWGASDTQWTLRAFDSGNNLLEGWPMPITTSSNAGEFYGISSAGIAYAILDTQTVAGSAGDYIFVDNFRYAPASVGVPEPATMLLLGLGLIGLAGFRKRS